MTAMALGAAGLQGWRGRVADTAALFLAHRTPLSESQVRAGIGAIFFALAVLYVVKTLRAWASRA